MHINIFQLLQTNSRNSVPKRSVEYLGSDSAFKLSSIETLEALLHNIWSKKVSFRKGPSCDTPSSRCEYALEVPWNPNYRHVLSLASRSDKCLLSVLFKNTNYSTAWMLRYDLSSHVWDTEVTNTHTQHVTLRLTKRHQKCYIFVCSSKHSTTLLASFIFLPVILNIVFWIPSGKLPWKLKITGFDRKTRYVNVQERVYQSVNVQEHDENSTHVARVHNKHPIWTPKRRIQAQNYVGP